MRRVSPVLALAVVTIDGHNAPVRHVGASTKFYGAGNRPELRSSDDL